jgi:hypothetical protein
MCFRARHPPNASASACFNDWQPAVPPARADVPTLVLAGEFHPVARLSQNQNVAAVIGPSALWVEFVRLGHDVGTPLASSSRASSPCGANVAADLIDNPARSPDTSCADRAASIRLLLR